jgi:hypothetical protein
MFKAYIDESGIHASSDMFVLAGYLAPVREWDRFVKKWQSVLCKYGIDVFHASDCNSNRGEFERFKGNKELRDDFVKELLATISTRRRILALNLGVVVTDFPDTAHRQVRAGAGHAYYVCMKGMMAAIHLVMNQFSPHEKVSLIFDRQDQFRRTALERFNEIVGENWDGKDRFANIIFGSAKDYIPLQAADALAFDSYREFRRRRECPQRPVRPSYAVLTTHKMMSPEWILDQAEANIFVNARALAKVNDELNR